MIGAAGVTAGVAAGAAGAAVFRREPAQRDWIWDDGSGLVGEDDGEWVQVAMVSDVMTNNAVRFSTPAFDGWVVNDDGEIRALGAVCTHMGCSLRFRPQWKDLRCPCHGASFDLTGALANGRSRWRTDGPYLGDDKAYPIALPDLVKPAFKVQYGRVWIWTAKSTRTTT